MKYKERIKKASDALKTAEYILIGAGAGLSDAAGLKYWNLDYETKVTGNVFANSNM